MSGNDKTKQKLMESMRMTKQGVSNKVGEVDATKNITPQDDKPVKKKEKSAPVSTKKASKDIKKPAVSSYQAARRVWPD